MKQTNSSLQTVLLGLLLDGGHLGPLPSHEAESRHPLSSRHLKLVRKLQSSVQQGPCVIVDDELLFSSSTTTVSV